MTSTQPLGTLDSVAVLWLYVLAFDEVNMCLWGFSKKLIFKADIHKSKQCNISFEKKTSFKRLLVMTYSLIFVFCIVLISYSTLIPVSQIIYLLINFY